MGREYGRNDIGEPTDVTREGRRLPACGVAMEAQTILVAGEWLETDDGVLIDLDIQVATLGPHGDVAAAWGHRGGC
jgi:hypothetical protein